MAVSNKAVGAEQSSPSAGSKSRKSTTARKVTTRHSASSGRKSSKSGGKNSSASKGSTNRRNSKTSSSRGKSEEVSAYQDHRAFQTGITILVILVLSVFLYLSCFGLAGKVGTIVGGLFFGVFGWFVYFLPLFGLIGFVFYTVNKGDRRVPRKVSGFVGIVLALLGLTDQIFGKEIITQYYTSNHVLHRNYFECMFLTCDDVMTKGKFNGGLIGHAVGTIFGSLMGKVGAVIILLVLLIFCLYIFYGVEMMGMIRKRNAYRQEMEEMYQEVSQEEDYREPSYRVFTKRTREVSEQVPESGRKHFTPRVMEKVPKVQAFDLTKMEAGSEEKKSRGAAKKKLVEKEPVKPDEGEKTKAPAFEIKEVSQEYIATKENANEKNIHGADNQSLAARQVNAVNSTNNGGLAISDDYADEDFVAGKVKSEKASVHSEIEAIPIYRNELNEKFGKKRKTSGAKVISFATAGEQKTVSNTISVEKRAGETNPAAEKMQDIGRPELFRAKEQPVSMHEEAPVNISDEMERETPDSMPEEVYEEVPVNMPEKEYEKVPVSMPDEVYEETSVSMPDEVYEETPVSILDEVHEEEPVGITDMVQEELVSMAGVLQEKEPVSTPNVLQEKETAVYVEETVRDVPDSELYAESMLVEKKKPLEPLSEAGQVRRQPKASSHGKIGGDDYVSASDTFNALNDSKVAVQQEIPYEFPSVGLLSLPEESAGKISDSELRMTASKLQDTLKSFNVNVRMGAVTCGPTVTRYELFPEQGVRVNKITNLADDLKLSLAAASIRIEAPIPGKAAVGIEVPNPVPSSVYFRELLEGDAFTNAKSDLTFAVGKDIGGKLIMADIAKMPHLLIAGATGSGKSVCINTLIMSILYKADPKEVKLIMIDPKVVELSVYNGIPHLFCPVVTDAKEAAAALNWAVREMMDRYNKFKELGVRNIAGYNEKIKTVENAEAAGYAKMPYLIVIVDEFADLMMVASKEVEDAVCRLAQLARAAGIHLVLATQRPSVNVITGVIKANIPSRIAFSVSSIIDSRTILDKGGAEKLLGKGDMLFFPSGYSEPVRVQGAFVSDKEVSDVVEFLCSNNETPEYDHSVTQVMDEPQEEKEEKKPQDDRDEYFADAGRFVIESERAAAGQLQRRFSIGFNRAGRIIDQLNKAGVVGPAEGTKPRKVLMTIEEFERMLSGGSISDDEMEAMVQEMEAEVVTTEEMF